ncbi:MAG TPA: cytochrome c biogenesis protein ResB [Blastocatellia bacterium]|nr:cytochrome c biogenesis protein ResB [Blastocatellia bacterium]HMV83624.1 cytochrome c biogenesis protein ResB [Blastocatellia bacterium]HMX28323.1 cytochrome c biogenesis protein ResB [Blastocatellia bacterium]HMY74824.1 cytochrome c biogenesis protein ResB [Blastocatellia bacterium]HMZ20623.1 cytochrome c biogenesis protein ResB [Blastocatellia bacterium]
MASVESSISKSSSLSESPELAVNSAASSESTVVEKAAPKAKTANSVSFIDRFLNLLSSVQFGIVLLILLIVACMIGMLIQQIELETFSGYYAELTPAEKTVYGRLGFFDIYHVWYFNLLLLLLSLNIILASIDHFPAAWSFITKKKLKASPMFAMSQKFREKAELPGVDRQRLTERASKAARAMGFKVRVTEEDSRTTIFAERGVWNRLGAYVVHIGLLTIFLGGFLTSRGFTGSMPIAPDETGNRMFKQTFNIDGSNQHSIGTQELQLPFSVEGVDIQQKPIRKEGGVDAGNSLDWLTRIRINDPETGKTTDALIHMNHPYDYRGYRFFQASLSGMNTAREIKLRYTPTGGAAQDVTIKRNGDVKLADGTRLKYDRFFPGAQFTQEGKIEDGSADFVNPVAHLLYVTPDGKQGSAWAFNEAVLGQINAAPFLKQRFLDAAPFSVVLTDYEKVSLQHILSVQYDPGAKIVYIGFTILCLMLIGVFFFSHQRLWIVIEDGAVHAGGDANRNRLSFEDRAKKVLALIREPKVA